MMHASWARLVARDVYLRTRGHGTDWVDYVQNATLGLIEAADNFDVMRGVEFRTFARHRVRGAVFNGLRQLFTTSQMRPSTVDRDRSESLSDDSENPLEAFVSWTVGLGLGQLLDIAADSLDSSEGRTPYEAADREQTADFVRRAVERLPERERLILVMHYFQHVAFVDIASHLGLTKGRISQIHRQAIEQLRGHFRAASLVLEC